MGKPNSVRIKILLNSAIVEEPEASPLVLSYLFQTFPVHKLSSHLFVLVHSKFSGVRPVIHKGDLWAKCVPSVQKSGGNPCALLSKWKKRKEK